MYETNYNVRNIGEKQRHDHN